MNRYTEDQLAAQRAAGAQVPDGSGRAINNGLVISPSDRARTQLTRERDNELAMQAGAPPTAQGPVGGSMLPRPQAMSGDVNSYVGSRYDRNFAANNNLTAPTQPTRYQGNNRQLNVARAKADGQFDSMRTQFNLANRDRQMDDMGTILPVPQANTQPAKPAAPQVPSALAPQAELPRPAQAAGPFELTYQKANGKFYGETRDGRGQVFDTQEQASAFSRGQAQQSQPVSPAPQQVAAQPPQFVPTPEQKRVLQQPVGSAAGRAFGVVPQASDPTFGDVYRESGLIGVAPFAAARGADALNSASNAVAQTAAQVVGGRKLREVVANHPFQVIGPGYIAPVFSPEPKPKPQVMPFNAPGNPVSAAPPLKSPVTDAGPDPRDPYAERVAMRRARRQSPPLIPSITPTPPVLPTPDPAAFPTLPPGTIGNRPRADIMAFTAPTSI